MATQKCDDCEQCDGVFTPVNDDLDEVDAAKVFQVAEASKVPHRYFLKDSNDVTPRMEKVQSYRMVHPHWGVRLSPVVEVEGLLGLVTLSGNPLTPSIVDSTMKHLLANLADRHTLEPLRWDPSHLLVHFPEVSKYTALADLFMNGKLQLGDDIKVKAIECVIFSNPPRALIRVTSARGHELQGSLADAVMPFSAAFTHLQIVAEGSCPVAPHAGGVPCLGLTMLFSGANQLYADQSLKQLTAPPWQRIPLTPHVTLVLDPGTYYFQNAIGGPLWGVKTGCPQPGVQVTVFVQKRDNFERMVEFYNSVFGVESVAREVVTTETSYRVFPLSTMSELMVAYYPGLRVVKSGELCLYVQARDADTMKTMAQMGPDRHDDGSRVHLEDPEGNMVAVYSPLK